MESSALGIFETFGFVAALAGADAALKSAEVQLLGCRFVGAGLVSVLVSGDVSSVKVAVESGCCAASLVGDIKWHTVIARQAEGLDFVVGNGEANPGGSSVKKGYAENPRSVAPSKGKRLAAQSRSEVSLQELYLMHVEELRGLARQLPDLSLDRPQIRSARKDKLIAAIVAYYQEQKE